MLQQPTLCQIKLEYFYTSQKSLPVRSKTLSLRTMFSSPHCYNWLIESVLTDSSLRDTTTPNSSILAAPAKEQMTHGICWFELSLVLH